MSAESPKPYHKADMAIRTLRVDHLLDAMFDTKPLKSEEMYFTDQPLLTAPDPTTSRREGVLQNIFTVALNQLSSHGDEYYKELRLAIVSSVSPDSELLNELRRQNNITLTGSDLAGTSMVLKADQGGNVSHIILQDIDDPDKYFEMVWCMDRHGVPKVRGKSETAETAKYRLASERSILLANMLGQRTLQLLTAR